MNQDNQTTPPFKPRFPFFHYLTMAAALIGVFLLWRQQDNSQKQIKALVQQNASLQQNLRKSQAKIADLTSGEPSANDMRKLLTDRATAQAQVDSQTSGEPPANAMRKLLANRSATKTPMVTEEQETLALQTPQVTQTDAGLSVHFAFQPIDGAKLPDQVTLVVRVPSTSGAKIISLKPATKPNNSNVECIVNSSGKLAMIEGSPSDLKSLSFELMVSEPVKATVRGSKGIKDFSLNIAPDGCTVQSL